MTDKEIVARLRWAVMFYSCDPGDCARCECKAVCAVAPCDNGEYGRYKIQTQRAAADCIERLTEENARLTHACDTLTDETHALKKELAMVKRERDDARLQHRTEMCEAGYDCAELGRVRKEFAQVNLERDAAVRDCAQFPCATCNNRNAASGVCRDCRCEGYRRTEHDWRGVCDENGGGDAPTQNHR